MRRFITIFSRLSQSQLQEKEKFNTLLETTQKELIKARTVFPFDFFPDTLTIDPVKVNYVHKIFFLSEEIKSILIEETGHVIVSCGPVFATLTIVDKIFSSNTIVMKPLFKKDAIKAQSILQGLLVSKKEHLDATKLINTQTDVVQMEKLGKTM